VRVDCLVTPIVDLSKSAIVKKGVTAVVGLCVAVVEGEYLAFGLEWLILVLVSPKWVGVFQNCPFPTALVWVTLFPVSF
jgi:hypothetical protein